MLAIDSDFLNTDAEMIRNTRGFAAARRLAKADDSMIRLWAVEAVFSNTGANADHRLRVPARSIPGCGRSARGRAGRGACRSPCPRVSMRHGSRRWRPTSRHTGRLAGRRRAAPAAGGARRGAGAEPAPRQPRRDASSYHEPVDALLPTAGGARRADDGARRRRGEDAGHRSAATPPTTRRPISTSRTRRRRRKKSSTSACTSTRPAQLANWHVPQAHFLEAWGDARASCGTLSVVQPLILPLYGGKSAVELLQPAGDVRIDRPGYDLVRETWQGLLGADFEKTLAPRAARRRARRQRAARGQRSRPGTRRPSPATRGAVSTGGGRPRARVRGLPQGRRRQCCQQRLAAGAARSAHQGHLGQPAARQPENRRGQAG